MERPKKQTKVPYLSPSAYKTFLKDKDEYYLRYLAPVKPPRFPQTRPMVIGSAFDAFMKNALYRDLISDPTGTPYQLDKLLETQCSKDLLVWATEEGKWLFEQYCKSGAYATLLQEFNGHLGPVQFEFTMQSSVKHDFKEVVLMGKPDMYFVTGDNWPVIVDFKVNGYCGNSNTSPKKGYLRCKSVDKNSGMHRNAYPAKHKGVLINKDAPLEVVDRDWAIQCAIYGWLSGEPVGKEFIVGIEQVACNGAKRDYADRPYPRFASHRSIVSKGFQEQLYQDLAHTWEVINSDHFFRELSLEASQRRCDDLDRKAQVLSDPNADPNDRFFERMLRNSGA